MIFYIVLQAEQDKETKTGKKKKSDSTIEEKSSKTNENKTADLDNDLGISTITYMLVC